MLVTFRLICYVISVWPLDLIVLDCLGLYHRCCSRLCWLPSIFYRWYHKFEVVHLGHRHIELGYHVPVVSSILSQTFTLVFLSHQLIFVNTYWVSLLLYFTDTRFSPLLNSQRQDHGIFSCQILLIDMLWLFRLFMNILTRMGCLFLSNISVSCRSVVQGIANWLFLGHFVAFLGSFDDDVLVGALLSYLSHWVHVDHFVQLIFFNQFESILTFKRLLYSACSSPGSRRCIPSHVRFLSSSACFQVS